jgi:hypothetical protein
VTVLEKAIYKPIDMDAKSGRPIIVRRGAEFARARWHAGGMWILDVPDPNYVEQLDFRPTHYRELVA